jgi:hypothetical protein
VYKFVGKLPNDVHSEKKGRNIRESKNMERHKEIRKEKDKKQ